MSLAVLIQPMITKIPGKIAKVVIIPADDNQNSWKNRKSGHHQADDNQNSWKNRKSGHHQADDNQNSWKNRKSGHHQADDN
ncbi:hypothetical protein [Bacillus sp. OK048]|uniref:hypothetical protein n=1 Tax=Bacillus sp. OK048 TaxID=1882761 RepID=UPI000B886EDC|nr:hypothetical protein [Bacillus sp. OK048]